MTSIADKKQELREEISIYFESYLSTLTPSELYRITMQCIWALAAKETLQGLETWANILRRRARQEGREEAIFIAAGEK